MSRSPVKAGKHVQRDRASTRGRQDRRRGRAQTPDSLLCSWIYANGPMSNLEGIEAVDCKRFLQLTANFDLSPCHRLIHLGTHVDEMPRLPQPAGWLALRAIYDYALRLNEPDGWRVHRATVSSAAEVLHRNVIVADVRERIARDGIAAGHRALDSRPEDGSSNHCLGLCYYSVHRFEEALPCFLAAMGEPAGDGWPALFRAYALAELRRWDEAIGAFDAVPLATFKGARAWRVDSVKESRAWCRLQRGDREGALAEFVSLLKRPAGNAAATRTFLAHDLYLVRAAAGPLRAELHRGVLALLERLDLGCGLTELPNFAPEVLTPAVVSLAERIAHESDFSLLPILGDALEEAGCVSPEVLGHCRSGADHPPRCWVVDLLLAR
jgi:tetratricopeptide (TPR) repeat protein